MTNMNEELSKRLKHECDVILDSLINLQSIMKVDFILDKRGYYDFNSNLEVIQEYLIKVRAKAREA